MCRLPWGYGTMYNVDQYDGTVALKEYGRTIAERTIKGLAARGIKGVYFESKEEAAEAVIKMIPDGATVGLGGSVTLRSTGLYDKILGGGYRVFNRYDPSLTQDERVEVERKALLADWFVSGTNAVTIDGQLVNADGHGNRVAALLFGPKKVIVVCGVNKIVRNLDEAILRIKQVATPLNAVRLGARTPCAITGSCAECRGAQRMCRLVTIIEAQENPERITVVFVGEHLGF